MKLLIADDSSLIREVTKKAAETLNMELLEAEDGADALGKLAEFYEEVGLILLDWNMPIMNGYNVLIEIKKNIHFKKIPVMMITSVDSQSSIIDAYRVGAVDYLLKPFTIEELCVKIREVLKI